MLLMVIFKADVALEGLELLVEMLHIALLRGAIDKHVAARPVGVAVSHSTNKSSDVARLDSTDLRVVSSVSDDGIVNDASLWSG